MSSLAARFPDVWFLACGGAFDFIAGDTRRAPHWMQRSGLEWFHRLVHEPRRLFGRYVVHDIPFAVSLLAHAVMTRRAAMQRTGRPEAWKTGERGLLGES